MKNKLCIILILSMLFSVHSEENHAYKILILGDIHYDNPEFHQKEAPSKALRKERIRNYEMWEGPSCELLKSAGKRAKAESCAFAIQMGDIAQGDADTPELLGKMLEKAFRTVKSYLPAIPLLAVKGNHDIRGYRKTIQRPADNVLMGLVAKEIGAGKGSSWTFRKGKDLYIGIDGFRPEKQCIAFVKKALLDNPETRYVFLVTHLPVIPATIHSPFWNLPGNFEIADLLEKRKAVILAGHTHSLSITTRKTRNGQLVQLVSTSLGRDWLSGKKMQPSLDWTSVRDAACKSVRGKNAENNKRKLETLDSKGEYSTRIYTRISGYVILKINDERVEAEIYTGEEKPSLREILVENRTGNPQEKPDTPALHK